MSAVINGTPVNFGFIGTNGITFGNSTLVGLLQSAEHEAQSDVEIVRNGIGEEVTHAWHNYQDHARLEWVVTGSTTAIAIGTNTAIVTPGTFVSITACSSVPSLVSSTWECQSGAKISGTNVNTKRISVALKKVAGITGAAS